MNYLNISKKVNDLNNGSYDLEQKRSIKYALYNCDLNLINPIINPNIPSIYMDMFVKFIEQGIDVAPYIDKVWETPVNVLEQQIKSENKSKIENEPKIKKIKNKGMK